MRILNATDEELQILAELLDSAVRYSGLQMVDKAVMWKHKIETSVELDEKSAD